MYWINRKVLRNTLRNPFNPCELISNSKANEIFTDIYEVYKTKYTNTWTRGSMPLNFFLDEYVKQTGADREQLEREIVGYIKSNEVIDKTK